jgi:hypothetical protein
MPAQASNPVPLILLFTAIGFIVGALVVYLVMLNEVKKIQGSSEPDLLKERKNRFQELAGLWRERTSGKLAVWLDEKMVTDSKSLNPLQRQQMESAGRELIDWLGVHADLMERPPENSATEAASMATPAVSQPIAPVPVTMEPVVAAAATPAAAVPVVPDRPLSIVEQVNDILKEILAGTPMEARQIRLSEDPRQGVIVWIGTDHYNGVDMVPDPEVKAVLRKAGSEWERRTDKMRR